MQASRSSRFGEKFGRRRNGLASSVFTASRLPEARSTTLDTTENAPRPITSHTSNLRSKSLGVPNASPTVLDSASRAAPKSPCSSVGGAAVSRSQDPDATPRGRFWEWCDGIFVASLRWRHRRPLQASGPAAGRRGGPKGWERLSRPRPPGFESKRARGAALRCEGVLGELPQSSDFFSARWGSQARRDGDGHDRILLHPNCFLFSRAIARDRLVLAPYQITVPREAAGESKGRRSQRPVLGGARAVVAAPPILRRLARHQNLGPPS